MVRVIVRATKSAMEKMHRKNFVIFSSVWCCKACLAVNFPCKTLLWGCSEDAPQTIPSGIENSFPSPVSRKMMAKRCQHTVGYRFVLHPISSMLSSWVWMFFWDGNAMAISGNFSYYCPRVCVWGGEVWSRLRTLLLSACILPAWTGAARTGKFSQGVSISISLSCDH